MKTIIPGTGYTQSDLVNLLTNSKEFYMAELATFTFLDGTVIRQSSLDVNVSWGGNTFLSTGLLMKRSKISQERGVQVNEIDLELYPTTTILGGITVQQAARNGEFDGGTFKLERVYFNSFSDPVPVGGFVLFSGLFSDVNPSRTCVAIKVKSYLELFNVDWPRNLYMEGCILSLYDTGCGLNKTTYTVSGTVTSGSTLSSVMSNLTQADDYFDLGVLTFLTGQNAGAARTVQNYLHTGGQVNLVLPLLSIPVAGDTFKIYPGCDKTMATCTAKYNNLAAFRGYPYVPPAETAY